MRTRSVQLVTSWWVVCVWAAVSLATGLVSVVAVLQPAWYVRYSQIHAQDVQGVAYQVMVSSVGPLGYCRLQGVEQVAVPGEKSRPGQVDSPGVSITNTPPTLSTSPFTPSTTSTSEYLQTHIQDTSSTSSPSVATDLLSTVEVPPTTSSPSVVQDPTPPADTDVSRTSVTSDEGSPSLDIIEIITVASNYTEINRSSDIPLTTAESFSRYGASEANEHENLKTKEPKDTTKIPGTAKEESNVPIIEVVTPSTEEEEEEEEEELSGGGGGGVRGREKKGRVTQPGTPNTRRGTDRRNTTAITRGRRKKGKHRRRKKKYNRKRPRPRDGGKTVQTVNRSHGPPRPDPPLHHLLRSRLEDNHAPVASPLRQPRPQEVLAHRDYRPRPPILSCSGVGGGVGSGSSAVWALVGVLYGVAGVVQVVVGVVSLATPLAYTTNTRKYTFAAWLGNAQVAVVMSQGVALVLFPLGLGSPLARGECGGSSSVYWPGECSFGWSYMLGVVATTLAAYCPCLARLTVFRKYDYKEWDSINFF